MKEVRVFDGEEFTIGQDMLRQTRSTSAARNQASAGTPGRLATTASALGIAAAAVATGNVGTLLRVVGSCAVLGAGLIGCACAGLYAFNKLAAPERRNKLIATYMPVVMRGLDRNMREVRAELLKGISGKVLDLGAGSGTYFKYINKPAVTEWVGIEPMEELHVELQKSIDNAQRQRSLGFETRVVGDFIDSLVAAESGTFDAVILGNVLCEVPEPIGDTLAVVHRLLKPRGRCYFSEHVYDSEHWWRAALQVLVHPWWVVVSGGCNCNRCQLEAIEACFGRENVCSWTLYAGSFPWTARFEVGLCVRR